MKTTRKRKQDSVITTWAEIRADHWREENGFIVAAIDAWTTNNPEEEGEVIANVIGIVGHDNELYVHVDYHDARARIDHKANSVIQTTINTMKADLFDERAGNSHITETRIDENDAIRIVLARADGIENGKAFAEIRAEITKPFGSFGEGAPGITQFIEILDKDEQKALELAFDRLTRELNPILKK